MKDVRLTPEQLEQIIGPSDESVAAAIIATGASAMEVEQALQFALGQDDVMGEMRRALSGLVAVVYNILITEEFEEDGFAANAE